MSWIKMYLRLRTRSEVTRLRAILGIKRRDVIGALAMLWFLGEEHATRRGHISGYTREMIDEECETPGFAAALEDADVDWIRFDERGCTLQRFEKYNTGHKRREQDAERQRRLRGARRAGVTHDKAVTASHGSVTRESHIKSRGDKRRVDERRAITPQPPAEPGGRPEARASEPETPQPTQPDPKPPAASTPPPVAPVVAHAPPRGWSRDEAVQAILAAYPPSNAATSPAAVKQALYRLGGLSGEAVYPDEATAATWLLGRVRAYAASPMARTTPQRFRPALGRWLAEQQYDQPDAAWQHPYSAADGADGAAADPNSTAAAAQRVIARMTRGAQS